MGRGRRSLRTIEADVEVGRNSIRVRKSPRTFLRGQRLDLRHGDHRRRLRKLLLAGAVVGPLYLYLRGGGLQPGPAFVLITAVGHVVQCLPSMYGDTTVEFPDVEEVIPDEDEQTLTVAWDPTDDSLVTSDDEVEVTLPTDDDVREARRVLRATGLVDAVDRSVTPTETEQAYRVDVKGGVVFCEACGTQVSPSDRRCPSCDYALHVERPVETDERALWTET